MDYIFPYTRFGGKYSQPIIPITLKYGLNEQSYNVLVDSGASINLFDAEIGEIIGIDIKRGRRDKVRGIGGEVDSWEHKLELKIKNKSYPISASFAYNHAWGYGLVGQFGFFSIFRILFDFKKQELKLRTIDWNKK